MDCQIHLTYEINPYKVALIVAGIYALIRVAYYSYKARRTWKAMQRVRMEN